jgi:hypothetical protein
MENSNCASVITDKTNQGNKILTPQLHLSKELRQSVVTKNRPETLVSESSNFDPMVDQALEEEYPHILEEKVEANN